MPDVNEHNDELGLNGKCSRRRPKRQTRNSKRLIQQPPLSSQIGNSLRPTAPPLQMWHLPHPARNVGSNYMLSAQHSGRVDKHRVRSNAIRDERYEVRVWVRYVISLDAPSMDDFKKKKNKKFQDFTRCCKV